MIFGKHFNKYYLKYGIMLILGLVALVIVDVGQLKIPEIYRMLINGMNRGVVEVAGQMKTFDMDFLLDDICFPLVIVILLMVTGRFLWRVCFFGAAIRVETDIREEMFNHCKDLSQEYYQVNKVGDLMSLFTNDLETVQDSFGNGVLIFFDAFFLGTLSLYKMLRMNVTLTAFSLLPMIFLFIAGSIVAKSMNKKWEERQEAFSLLSDFAQESFSGIAVIKAFAKEAKELLAFKKLNVENENANVAYTKVSTFLQVAITLFVESVVCVILGYGGYLVYTGVFDAGEMVEFIGYFTTIVWPIEAIALLMEMSAKGKASLKRIGELLDAKIAVADDKKKLLPLFMTDDNADTKPYEFRGDIEFRNLTFQYPGSTLTVLDDVSFTIKAGENVGIIGRTGTGKTTIVDLLTRIYNVKDGTLFIDGMDVNTIPIKTLRDQVAYVPQDNFLFSDTIANNIAFSIPDVHTPAIASGKRKEKEANQSQANWEKYGSLIESAAKLSDVHGNIEEFPDKYETLLGERGVTVSGGQKQRISIARALLKDSAILILDDSVSAVDTKTEKAILDNLKATRAGKTTILIAHRISTIKQMDKVIFVDEGKVIGCGTAAYLEENCHEFAEMVKLQKLEDEEKEDK